MGVGRGREGVGTRDVLGSRFKRSHGLYDESCEEGFMLKEMGRSRKTQGPREGKVEILVNGVSLCGYLMEKRFCYKVQ